MIHKFKIFGFIFLLFSISQSYSQLSDNNILKLTQVLRNVSNYYVDTINGEKMVNRLIVDALSELDPHSSFYTKDQVDDLNRDLAGSFTGIGISYLIIRDSVRIMSTIHGGPSEKSGIKQGDRIIFVEDKNIASVGVTDKDLKSLLLGDEGSKVKISVFRPRHQKLISFNIERSVIKLNSVEAAYMATKDVGYIKLEKFAENTTDDFLNAAKMLKKAGAEHLIIDLQGNGGGYLKAAVNICDNFFNNNELILYTEGAKSPKIRYFATEGEKINFNRLIILMDEGSASASEILAGAIQDWDRGIILGRRSFGKGLVQRPFYLADGSMMRLTVARYYTPSGRCIQKSYSSGKNDYYKDINSRFENGELMNPDSIKFADSLKFNTLRNKRVIYGGGGIMPDVFVPLDTTLFPEFYKEIVSNGKLLSFIHDFVDRKREYFNTVFYEFEKFDKDYFVDENLIRKITDFAWSEKSAEKDKNKAFNSLTQNQMIKIHIKALIANDLWDDEEYYKITNKTSSVFLKAVDVISDNDKYNKIIKNKL